MALIRAMGASPSARARSRDITSSAEAPSEMAEELPAVMVPRLGSKAGLSAARASRLVSPRTTSSWSNSAEKPFSRCPSTGTISAWNRPPTMASYAF